jgi:hypothetical protein
VRQFALGTTRFGLICVSSTESVIIDGSTLTLLPLIALFNIGLSCCFAICFSLILFRLLEGFSFPAVKVWDLILIV